MPDAQTKKIPHRNAMAAAGNGNREVLPPGSAPDAPLAGRIEQLPRDVGWMLFGVGFAGFVAPGIFGLPFMVAGGMILWPKTTGRLQNLLGKPADPAAAPGMKQITRFLDDLERRYPPVGKP